MSLTEFANAETMDRAVRKARMRGVPCSEIVRTAADTVAKAIVEKRATTDEALLVADLLRQTLIRYYGEAAVNASTYGPRPAQS